MFKVNSQWAGPGVREGSSPEKEVLSRRPALRWDHRKVLNGLIISGPTKVSFNWTCSHTVITAPVIKHTLRRSGRDLPVEVRAQAWDSEEKRSTFQETSTW